MKSMTNKTDSLIFFKLLEDTQHHRVAKMHQSKSCMPKRRLGHRIFSLFLSISASER